MKHHFPNLTLTTLNFFITFLLLLLCVRAKLVTYVHLPIFSMLPVSACFGGFIAFSNLSLQYNTVGTYQLIKLQVTPSAFVERLAPAKRNFFLLAVMILSWFFFKARYPPTIILSFAPVLVGTLISTYYDLQFNGFGLLCKHVVKRVRAQRC